MFCCNNSIAVVGAVPMQQRCLEVSCPPVYHSPFAKQDSIGPTITFTAPNRTNSRRIDRYPWYGERPNGHHVDGLSIDSNLGLRCPQSLLRLEHVASGRCSQFAPGLGSAGLRTSGGLGFWSARDHVMIYDMKDLLRQEIATAAQTVIVKVGTRVLTGAGGTLNQERVAQLAEELHLLAAPGRKRGPGHFRSGGGRHGPAWA